MALRAERFLPAFHPAARAKRWARPDGAYTRILVPLVGHAASQQATAIACRLAAEHHAIVTAITVIELPAELPLDAHMFDEERHAKRVLSDAQAIGDLYGVTVEPQILRARSAGEAIVQEARRAQSEIIVLGTPRKKRIGAAAPVFGRTVDVILKHAPCRVMVAASPNR
jgi:basic amino acid/polyamine antiporter, APA family